MKTLKKQHLVYSPLNMTKKKKRDIDAINSIAEAKSFGRIEELNFLSTSTNRSGK